MDAVKKKSREKRVYNSGKISGLNFFDVQVKFEKADKEIEALGLNPVNPLNSWIPRKSPWLIHMVADTIILLSCKKIYLQEDWEDSKGAKIEKKIADRLGYEIIFQSDKVNAKKVNIADDQKEAFLDAFLKGVKIRFERGDGRIAEFMKIARSFGVTWTMEEINQPKESSDYFPANGLLYVWESRTGSLHFAHGGGLKYFHSSDEREIRPDVFFDVWNKITSSADE